MNSSDRNANGSAVRDEQDFLGHKSIPADAYWGVHTARAVENFAISEVPVGVVDDLVRALAYVKKAAAQANADLGVIDRKRAGAIILACEDLIAGRLHDQLRGLRGEQPELLVRQRRRFLHRA
jgi:aspartate ammonia-lyase